MAGMNKEHKTDVFKYWLPVISFILIVGAYVWSSATRVQTIDSRSVENRKKIEDAEKRVESRLDRIENKLDILISKTR